MPTRQTRVASRRVYRRRRQVVLGGLMFCGALLLLAGFRLATGLPLDEVAAAKNLPTQVTKPRPQVSLFLNPAVSLFLNPAKSPTSPRPSTSPKLSTPPKLSKLPPAAGSAPVAPIRATGTFGRASGGGARYGSGTLLTYRVEVEVGTRQSVQEFASAADATLADPASWAGQGRWSFRRVTGGGDFVIRLATPATVDRVCATSGLETHGYASCQSGKFVMVNLVRWLNAVPEYHGDVASYRRYVINHEVGHRLGYGHQACPGRGRLAPVMQQQTFGLRGCLPNGWPLVDGKLVSGPAAP